MNGDTHLDRLRSDFRQRFGEEPAMVRAPGRVNLIGEHTDYNDGFVMPAAIHFATWAAVAPRDDRRVVAQSLQFPGELNAELGSDRARSGDWTDYAWGVAASMRDAGVETTGANIVVSGDVPVGAGLSSSASIEVAVGFALLTASGLSLSPVRLAQICQAAENRYVGARCGIMDQFIACTGQSGQCVLLDCRSLDYRYAPVPAAVALVICNTMVKHSIAGGEYNRRRAECEQGVELLARHLPGIRALRDVSPDALEKFAGQLPEVVRRRCRHVVNEDARVQQASGALNAGDLDRFGRLMYESHASLRDDYEVSCPELDVMVELAREQQGVIGARMTGGGFGGCTVNLVQADRAESFRSAMLDAYERRMKIRPEIYITQASEGVGRRE